MNKNETLMDYIRNYLGVYVWMDEDCDEKDPDIHVARGHVCAEFHSTQLCYLQAHNGIEAATAYVARDMMYGEVMKSVKKFHERVDVYGIGEYIQNNGDVILVPMGNDEFSSMCVDNGWTGFNQPVFSWADKSKDIALIAQHFTVKENTIVPGDYVLQSVCEEQGVSPTNVYDLAMSNLVQYDPTLLPGLPGMINPNYRSWKLLGRDPEKYRNNDVGGPTLFTGRGRNSAAALFLPEVQSALRKAIGADYYVVFVSKSEAFIHKQDSCEIRSLERLLRDTNESFSEDNRYLTDEIFRYSASHSEDGLVVCS